MDPIDPCNRLHKTVHCQRFVQIHGVRRWTVEARQPHVAHDDEAEIVIWALEALGQTLSGCLSPHVVSQRLFVGSRAGDNHLHRTAFVVGVMPCWAQRTDHFVEPCCDVAAHGHDHRLALHRCAALLPVLDDEFRQPHDASLRAYQCL